MPRRSPFIPCIVTLTPREGEDVNVQAVCEYLRAGGHFRTVGIDPDGSIEVSAAERRPGEARNLVKSCLDEADRSKFVIGEPPP